MPPNTFFANHLKFLPHDVAIFCKHLSDFWLHFMLFVYLFHFVATILHFFRFCHVNYVVVVFMFFFSLFFFLILFLASFECLVAALKVSLWPTAWSVYCLPAWPCSRPNEPCAKRQPQSSHRKCFEVHRYVVWCDVVCCVLTYAIVAVDIGFCNNFVAHHFRKRNTHTSHILIVWLSVLGVCMSHFNSCILWRAF